MIIKTKKVIAGVLTLIALLILFCVLFSGNYVNGNATFNNHFEAYSFIKYSGLAFILVGISAMTIKLSFRHEKIIKLLLWMLIIFMAIIALIIQPYAPVYDSMNVNEQVFELVQNYPNPHWSTYFSVFPNNVPITIFLFWIDFLFKYFLKSMNNLLLLNAIVGQVLMLLSLHSLSKIAEKIFGSNARNVLLVFCLFTPTYLMQFTQIGYSDTFSLPFLIIGIKYLINVFYNSNEDSLKITDIKSINWGLCKNIFCSGLYLSIALFLRPNVIVALLGVFFVLGTFFWKQWRRIAFLCVVVLFFSFGAQKVSEFTQVKTNYYQLSINQDNQMPTESWLLTAYYLGGRSGNEINQITDKYVSFSQRKAYIQKELFKKIKSLGVLGIIMTWRDKANILFGIKSDFGMQYFSSFRNASDKKRQNWYEATYRFLTPKMIHITMTATLTSLFSFILIPFLLHKNRRQTTLFSSTSFQKKTILLLILSIFDSLSLFYILLWEVQEHYIYMMLPFLLLLGAVTWTLILENFIKRQRK
ncbi:hypothetical protein D0501_07605 [Leuconostoc holzapfelii]|uniref:Beta-carotene 15,15'-monooxygenase n=1 Tax=Leuconostoc holzapfelii TaxID=434464 RepID=A0ABT2P0P3_9LACO|nr:hypothetical protein [Leuconostoc holzapfelii]MCT8389931.1 hypothetical protein [Leuconostoc holzapfelii]